MEEIYRFIIPIPPVTKKNSSNIFFNKATGKRFITPSDRYKQYEKDFLLLCPNIPIIDYPISLKALYYMPTHKKVDLINLHSALHDCLVKKNVLLDDNCSIIVSTDGSRVYYDKNNPRTEIYITKL
jgi:Holliday junction resolvase RusA-like endonuclease